MYLRFHKHQLTLNKSVPYNDQLSRLVSTTYAAAYIDEDSGFEMGSNTKLFGMKNGYIGWLSLPTSSSSANKCSPFVLLLVGLLTLFKAHYHRVEKKYSAAAAGEPKEGKEGSTTGWDWADTAAWLPLEAINPKPDSSLDRYPVLDHDAMIRIFEGALRLPIEAWKEDKKLDYDQFQQITPMAKVKPGNSASTTHRTSHSQTPAFGQPSSNSKRQNDSTPDSGAGPSTRKRLRSTQ